MNDDDIDELMKILENARERQRAGPDPDDDNLEWVLRNTDSIVNNVISSDEYAQHLYATLCNNKFLRGEVLNILQDQFWSCTWRYAGGIIAAIRGSGDYLDWYCSGNEGNIFSEIESDLKKIGWAVIPYEYDN